MSAERGFKGIDALRKLRPDISAEAIKTATRLLLITPFVVPRNNGGIQLEWHETAFQCEVVINPDGTVQKSFGSLDVSQSPAASDDSSAVAGRAASAGKEGGQ
jgi:hypothetical protein